METTLKTPFNAAQVELLKILSQELTDAQLEELRSLLLSFKLRLLDEHLEKVAKKKGLTPQQINKASLGHRRREYTARKKAMGDNAKNA